MIDILVVTMAVAHPMLTRTGFPVFAVMLGTIHSEMMATVLEAVCEGF